MVLRVGIVGTGYAAAKRAEAVASGMPSAAGDVRTRLVAVAGTPDRAQVIAQQHGAKAMVDWRRLLAEESVDLVIVATVNAYHGEVVAAALQAGRHVVVEYPLALDVAQAQALVKLAANQQRLLHVEHIELLGGLHQAAKAYLAQVGQIESARYTTLAPQHPAPKKWSYQIALSGFPLVSALSRVSRLVDLFGRVTAVTCQSQFDGGRQDMGRLRPVGDAYYRACLCEATLRFACGVTAALVYGKGERDWARTRRLEIVGTRGQLHFDGDQGYLRQSVLPGAASAQQAIAVKPRRGLFRQDTQQVVGHLLEGTPLWPPLSHSLYALTVADALRRSAETGREIRLDDAPK
ncbi:MAG: Gfo/Idh/MocA family oxidoreductase [Cyanobacteria bacterium J06632_22]